jgi:transcriptional regulator with XRE-family HTH domain
MSDQLAGRIRAARAYADKNQLPFAKETSIGKKRLQELEAGSGEPATRNELLLVSEHSGVPIEFLMGGFAYAAKTAPTESTEASQQITELHEMVTDGLDILKGMQTDGMVALGRQIGQEVRRQLEQDSEAQQRRKGSA